MSPELKFFSHRLGKLKRPFERTLQSGAGADADECPGRQRQQSLLERRDQRQQRLQFDRVSIQQNHCNRKAGEVLLMRQVLVDSHEGIKPAAHPPAE